MPTGPALLGLGRRLRAASGERGPGTAEYVSLILLVSMLMVGMVAAMRNFNEFVA